MAQVKARPPTFVLFASRADQLPDHYRRYLVHSLRESFDLPGVPIRLTVKSNRNPFVEGEPAKERASGRKETVRRAAPAEPLPSVPAPAQPTARALETPAPRPPQKPRPAVLKGTKGPKAMAKKAKIASRAARGPMRPKTSRPKSKGR
jgi:GTP-binding protein